MQQSISALQSPLGQSSVHPVQSAPSPQASSLVEQIRQCRTNEHVNSVIKRIYRAAGDGTISEVEAHALTLRANGMRPAYAHAAREARRQQIELSRQFKRGRQGSPDRQASRQRRRTWGGSSALPPELRAAFTEGQRAVMAVIVDLSKGRGFCDAPIDRIAAIAGVCRTTARDALHEARRLGLITLTERPLRGRKSLTNLVKVVARAWLRWIERAKKTVGSIGSKTAKMLTAKEIYSNKYGHYSDVEDCGKPSPVPINGGVGACGHDRLAKRGR